MPRLQRFLAIPLIFLPAAALLSMGCGLFTLPVDGPKALAKNAERLHFTLDIVDDAGMPLPDVTLEIRLLSADADLLWGEVEKSEAQTKTVSGHYEYDGFGKYAVLITVSKPGYGTTTLLCSNKEKLVRERSPGLFAYPHLPIESLHEVNVEKFSQQHVVLTRGSQTAPADKPVYGPAR
jgi:hypothetical protein